MDPVTGTESSSLTTEGTADAITAPVTTETSAETIETPEAQAPSVPEIGLKPKGKTVKQPLKPMGDAMDWKTDARYGKGWKSENDLYKSYRELEKWKAENHDPLKKQFDEISNTLKDEGYSVEQIREIIQELKTWKDPENVTVQNGNFVNQWLDNPLYKDSVVALFKDLQTKELQRKYPGYTQEQIERIQQQEQKINELETWKQQQEQNRMVSEYGTQIKDNMGKIKSLADSRGFKFDAEMETAFYTHCQQNNVDPKYMLAEFRNLYDEAMDKAQMEKIQSQTLKSVAKNKSASIIDGKTTAAKPAEPKEDLRGGLRNAIKKMRLFE
jgi:DNA-binding transcriptional MerR regulator